MDQTDIQQIEEDLAGLREGLDTETVNPPVSAEAAKRRREWVERSRREIDRLERLHHQAVANLCPACRGTGGGQYNDCLACDGNGVIA